MVRPVSPNREAGLFWFWNLGGHLVFVRKRLWGEREREAAVPSLGRRLFRFCILHRGPCLWRQGCLKNGVHVGQV